MTNKVFTEEQKLAICTKFSELASDIEKYKSLSPAARDSGLLSIGIPVGYFVIRETWIKEEGLSELIQEGLLARAEAYVERAEKEMDATEEKIKVYYDTWVATNGKCGEMITVINHSKFKVEKCERWAGKLAPEVYGDYYYQIKECQNKIKDIQNQLVNMVPGKC